MLGGTNDKLLEEMCCEGELRLGGVMRDKGGFFFKHGKIVIN